MPLADLVLDCHMSQNHMCAQQEDWAAKFLKSSAGVKMCQIVSDAIQYTLL